MYVSNYRRNKYTTGLQIDDKQSVCYINNFLQTYITKDYLCTIKIKTGEIACNNSTRLKSTSLNGRYTVVIYLKVWALELEMIDFTMICRYMFVLLYSNVKFVSIWP